MAKNYNGYFSIWDESEFEDDVAYHLKVENNKIVGASFSAERGFEKTELEGLLKDVIGEDFKDFIFEKMLHQEYGGNWVATNEHDDADVFDTYRIEESRNADELGLSKQGYQDKIASILRSKENRMVHDNMLNRISEIKNKKR